MVVHPATRTTCRRVSSVTYGADGSTRERTPQRRRASSPRPADAGTAPDLVSVRREESLEVARQYWDAGVRISPMAGGDPPADRWLPTGRRRLRVRQDLVRGLRAESATSRYPLRLTPRSIPRRPSAEFDPDRLAAKIDAGADRAITQFFFDTDAFLRFPATAASRAASDAEFGARHPADHRFPQMLRFASRWAPACRTGSRTGSTGLDDDPRRGG